MKLKKFSKSFAACLSAFCLVSGSMSIPNSYGAEEAGIVTRSTVDGFGYDVVLEVLVNEDGTIKEVKDAGTEPGTSNKTFWRTFLEGNGLKNFTGKSKSNIDQVDAVTDATVTSKAAKNAVKQALANVDYKPEEPSAPAEKYPRLTPGVKKGEAAIPGESSSRKMKVIVTVGEDGRISKVENNGSSVSFSKKQQLKDYWGKFKGSNYFVGKTLKEVIEMDVHSGYGAHVPGSRGEDSPYAPLSLGARNAVLNALGYDYTMKESDTDKVINVVSILNRYNYEQRFDVRISKEGKVVSIVDKGTDEESNYKTSDNLHRIKLFNKGKGYDKYIGKTLSEVKAMDTGKHGIDGVAGATYNATAVKSGVISAFEKGGFDTNVEAAPIGGRMFKASSTSAYDNTGKKIKIRAYIDNDNRIIKVLDDGSNPGESPWTGLHHEDDAWDKFAKYRGFAKFNGKSLDEVNAMNMSSPDSIDVAGRQIQVSAAAKEAVIAAINMAMSHPIVDKEALKSEISKAKEFLKTVVEGEEPGQYPLGTMAKLQAKIGLAEKQVNNDIASEDEVNTAKNELKAEVEMAKQSVIKVNKDELKEAISKAKEFLKTVVEGEEPGQYPEGTTAKLQEKIDLAETQANSEMASKEDVASAKAQLDEAVEMAKQSVIKVNKDELKEAISKAKEFLKTVVEGEEPGQYPEGTTAKLQEKIDLAETQANSEMASKEDVALAKAQLDEAVEMIKETVVKPLMERELKSIEHKVSVKAMMSEKAELMVKNINLEIDSLTLDKALKEDGRISKVIGTYDISIINGKYKEPIVVSFNLGNDANGKKMVIKHVKHDGQVESKDTVVENGTVSITVDSLSPFAVSEFTETTEPDTPAPDPDPETPVEDPVPAPNNPDVVDTDVANNNDSNMDMSDDNNKVEPNSNKVIKPIEKSKESKNTPKTADNRDLAVVMTIMLISATVAVLFRRKFNK